MIPSARVRPPTVCLGTLSCVGVAQGTSLDASRQFATPGFFRIRPHMDDHGHSPHTRALLIFLCALSPLGRPLYPSLYPPLSLFPSSLPLSGSLLPLPALAHFRPAFFLCLVPFSLTLSIFTPLSLIWYLVSAHLEGSAKTRLRPAHANRQKTTHSKHEIGHGTAIHLF